MIISKTSREIRTYQLSTIMRRKKEIKSKSKVIIYKYIYVY